MGRISAQAIVNKSLIEFPAAESSRDSLVRYLIELLRWNDQLGLVSRHEPLRACERLLLESLELLAVVEADAASQEISCVDVGSGGGFPGIVWALSRPRWRLLLIERKARRAAFLQSLVARLSLSGVEVLGSPVEEAHHTERHREGFDIAVAMAVARPEQIGRHVAALLRAHARFYTTAAAGAALPARIGELLERKGDTHGHYGNYVCYRKVS